MVFFLGKAPYTAEQRRPVKGVLGVIAVITLIALAVFGTIVYDQITAAREPAKIRSAK